MTEQQTATFALSSVTVAELPGSITEISSNLSLSAGPVTTLEWLRGWAERRPKGIFISEVIDGTRIFVDYETAWRTVVLTAIGLAEWGVGAGDRVAVVARNSFEHFAVGHATMLIGAIYAPIATQYLTSKAQSERISGVLEALSPVRVFVPDPTLRANVPADFETFDAAPLSAIPAAEGWMRVGAALLAAISPEQTAKLLLTSGSTGAPKAVIYTHRMLVSNIRATADVWPFVTARPPVLVEWLPWNHAFGGNQNLNMVLLGGGTMHIDEAFGSPTALGVTVDNITRFRPTFYGAVPAGFQALLPELARNFALREALLGGVDALFSAGASMPSRTLGSLRELAEPVRTTPLPVLTGWGSTEVGPSATMVHSIDARPNWIGPPIPGVTVRLVPVGEKRELRVRGHSVTAGYWGEPLLSAGAFDDDGFYRSGDAGELADAEHPELGLRFDGRIANDFKLANGSWVNVDRLREELLTIGGAAIRDVVILAPDRPRLLAWFWLWPEASLDVDATIRTHNSRSSGQTNTFGGGAIIDFEIDDDLLSPKHLIKAAAFRTTHRERIERLYETTKEVVTP